MSTDDRGVEEQPVHIGVLHGVEEALPRAVLAPAVEASEDRVPRAEAFGQVAPRSALVGDEVDGVEEEAVVASGASSVADLAG